MQDFLSAGELNREHPTVQFLYQLAQFPKPLVAAVAHTGGAAAMVIVLMGALSGSHSVNDKFHMSQFNISKLSR